MWKDNKTKDYKFVDNTIYGYFKMSGTKVLIHKFIGHYDEEGNPTKNKIQDLLFMETRDRHYAPEVYEDFTIYQMSDSDFELSQFGFFNIDTLFMDFHLNKHAEQIGRKLSSGDVLELVHMRDDMLEDREGAINAFYVVEDAKRSAEGYDARWLPHIWRVRVKKMDGSREYNDILENHEDGIENLMKQYHGAIDIDNAIVGEAENNVPSRGIESPYEHLYQFDGALPLPEEDQDIDLESIPRLRVFPMDAKNGDFIIRTDYEPNQLFKKIDGKWVLINIQNIMPKWTRGHDVQVAMVENNNTTTVSGYTRPERTYITRPVDIPIDDESLYKNDDDTGNEGL